ncbi:hypothetical protein M0M57_12995 [Flavobacterium azooxidireducens]|uniref:Glycerophosphoryl diester phosphodiesterase membrane domain-containing protein n=1 Tax=Flavobacterium azooxidireducens TaxID=1871076 RepID=A0ABY4KGF2_9FLAO|nr:hypothetical protein [Flavobacterium azooxidireducens]UPQ78532.1 hypothetical protein M0M57_12995 [Flavobacterium azooxidireducens]
MFQLFKKRNFSDYISDTFTFFKVTGKHFFKNYFIINGTLLILLMVLTYFVFKVYFEMMFANIGVDAPNFLEDYFNNNIGLIIGVFLMFFFLLLFVSLINYSFPVLYMNLYEKHKGSNFESKEIVAELKSKFGKIITFFLVMILLSLTAGLIIMGLLFALMFIVIGFFLALIVFPAMLALVQLSFYEYMNAEIGVFDALGKGFEKLKQNFWPIVGSTLVMYVIIYIVMLIFTMVPYIIGVASLFTNIENQGSQEETLSFVSIMMVLFMCLSILFTYILNNLLLVNNGIIYYSLREQNENKNTLSDIDLIGTDSE